MFGDVLYPALGKVLQLASAGRLTLAVFISVWFSQCAANRGLQRTIGVQCRQAAAGKDVA